MEGSHVLDRALRYGPAARRRLPPRVVPAWLVLMVRTVLLVCLGLGTLHAQIKVVNIGTGLATAHIQGAEVP
jgi:hypothetical protein